MREPVLELQLPFPPSLNHYYRRWGDRMLISRAGRQFREQVCALVTGRGVREMTGPLHIVIDLYPPDRRRRDVDNSQKALLDALEHGGVYGNDSQIMRLEIEKHEPVSGGRTRVRIQKHRGRRRRDRA